MDPTTNTFFQKNPTKRLLSCVAKKSLRGVSHADDDKLSFTGGQFYASRHFMLMRFHIVCISSKQGNVKVIDRDSKNHSLIQFYKFLDIRSRFKLSISLSFCWCLILAQKFAVLIYHLLEMFKESILKK